MTHPSSPRPTTPPPPPGPKHGAGRLYSVAEVAELWSCSDQHVYNLIAAGAIARADIGRHGKAKTRIAASEIERFIASRTRRATKGRQAA